MIIQKQFWKISLFLLPFLFPACSSDDTTEPDSSSEIKKIWEWDNYLKSDRLDLQEISGMLQAQDRFLFVMPTEGIITWEQPLLENNTFSKGTLLGTINKDQIELKEKELPLLQEIFDLQKENIRSIQIPQKKIALLKELQNLTKEKNLARRIEEDPEMLRTVTDLFPNLEVESNQGKVIINDLEKALQKELTILSDLESSSEWKELRLKELELQSRRMELDKTIQDSLIKMPFDGVFESNFDISSSDLQSSLRKGKVIGIAQNTDRLIITVNMTNSPWLSIPSQYIEVKMKARGLQQKIIASFWKSQISVINNQERLEYLFVVPPEDKAALDNFLETRLEGVLQQKLPRTAYLVPKLDFFLHLPSFRKLPWQQALEKEFPKATVLGEGISYLAISPDR